MEAVYEFKAYSNRVMDAVELTFVLVLRDGEFVESLHTMEHAITWVRGLSTKDGFTDSDRLAILEIMRNLGLCNTVREAEDRFVNFEFPDEFSSRVQYERGLLMCPDWRQLIRVNGDNAASAIARCVTRRAMTPEEAVYVHRQMILESRKQTATEAEYQDPATDEVTVISSVPADA